MTKNRKNLFVYIFLIAGIIIVLFPFFWMILSAFKSDADVYSYPPRWFPEKWNFDNFLKVFDMVPFGIYYMNNIIVTFFVTFGQVFISILAAFALSRLNFPFKKLLTSFFLITMLMPFVITMIPTFLIISNLKWIDTYQGLIVPFLFSGFSIFFLTNFFKTIPNDLQDAAKIDGCGYFRILFSIILPNARPAISTISMFTFLGQWRSYLWPLIATNTTEMRTLPIGLRYLVSEGGGEYQIMMAASLMAIIPVLIVYMFCERQFIKSVAMTGLK